VVIAGATVALVLLYVITGWQAAPLLWVVVVLLTSPFAIFGRSRR
jgi:hypothetical protein